MSTEHLRNGAGAHAGVKSTEAVKAGNSVIDMPAFCPPKPRKRPRRRAYLPTAWVGVTALGPIDVRRLAEEHFGRLHHRLGERRMRMDGELQVGGVRAHLDREHAFRDQLARAGADQADAEDPLGLGIENQLRSGRRCDRA